MQNQNARYAPQRAQQQQPLPPVGQQPPGMNQKIRPGPPQIPPRPGAMPNTSSIPAQYHQQQQSSVPQYAPPGMMQRTAPPQSFPPSVQQPPVQSQQRPIPPQQQRPAAGEMYGQPQRPQPGPEPRMTRPSMNQPPMRQSMHPPVAQAQQQNQQPLHGQMQNLSLQQNAASNGHMLPGQRPIPQQPPPRGAAYPGPPAPGGQAQISRPGYPAQPRMPPGQHQPPSQPGAQYAAQPNAPLRPANTRPNPGVAPSRPLPPGYAGSRPQQNGYGAPGQQMSAKPNGQPPGPPREQAPAQVPTSMMPRPCSSEKPSGTPRAYYHRGMSLSGDRDVFPFIPTSNSDFISIDDGSSRIRFMRLTANAIASDPNVMAKCGVPLAVVMTPFANTTPGETPVPIVDFTSKQVSGPLRCERCNGYANPGFKFMNGGSQFQCNLCTHVNTTPTEHFSPISPVTGLRTDADQRHELRVGSVDFHVGSMDYCLRPPQPARYLFAVDVSAAAIGSGLASAAMMSIKSAIGAGLLPGSADGARVAIMTYDKALHFFDGRGAEDGKAVTVQFVSDIMDPFVPLGGEALFLTPTQAVQAVDCAIEIHSLGPNAQQQQMAANGPSLTAAESALGSALQAIKLAFADCGGKAYVVAGSLPTAGVLKLERRGGGALGGGEKREMELLAAANSSYDILGCELAEVQASVDLFLAPPSVYIDAATLSRVPRACGGRMHLFPGFDPIRDGASLHRSLCVAASQPRAFECLMRVRTSPGIEARGEYLGHFGRPQRGDDVSGPVMDASSTLALEMAVTSKLTDDDRNGGNQPYGSTTSLYDDACVQCAILYTDCAGRRCIRVHTTFASKTSVLADVFRHTDVDATAALFAKKAGSAVLVGGTSFTKAGEVLTEKTAQMFYVYRKHCSSASLTGQLILPESLKVLPIMMLGLLKSAGFRRSAASVQSGDAVTIDERAAALSFLTSGTVSEIVAMCYPRMYELQEIADAVGKPLPSPTDPVVTNSVGNTVQDMKSKEPIALPNTLPLSAESLLEKRILLIENGMQIVVWLGTQVEKSAAEDVIKEVGAGRLCIRAETAGAASLTKDVSERGRRVAKVIERIISQRRGLSRPQVVVRSAPGAGGEAKFVIPLLIEDRGNGSHSYMEYLRHVHKRVMEKMANDSHQSEMQTWEMLNHGY